jgi:hypothetical protein
MERAMGIEPKRAGASGFEKQVLWRYGASQV